MQFGGQQWTFRNLYIHDCSKVGLDILWNWVFIFVGLRIEHVNMALTS